MSCIPVQPTPSRSDRVTHDLVLAVAIAVIAAPLLLLVFA